jgi:guanine deaminase
MTAADPNLPAPRAYRGTILHTPERGRLEYLENALIVCAADGTIESVHTQGEQSEAIAARHARAGTLTSFGAGLYLLPGLIDLHVHAPQWPQLGKALDEPLEIWLQKYTFPLEARYADEAYAAAVYESLVGALLANGTTTAVYYGTIHLPATERLADICLRRSQRALIGRVAMDDASQCPAYYRDASPASAEADTRAFIDYVRAMPGNGGALIEPVVTPRFIPACSDALLRRLGALARATGCHVQTHCSESDWEHRFVQDRCGRTDTAALEGYGLLSRRTILAHGNFIGDEDVGRIVGAGAGIAHCPLSNVYFSDAVFPLRHMLEHGVHVGLGTDIAGGASPSILDNARHAILASRRLEAGVDPALERARRGRAGSRIDALTAFWLATAGGGIALDKRIGVFAPGYAFDAIVVDTHARDSNLALEAADAPEAVLQKIIYSAVRSNIRNTFVAGRLVHASATE